MTPPNPWRSPMPAMHDQGSSPPPAPASVPLVELPSSARRASPAPMSSAPTSKKTTSKQLEARVEKLEEQFGTLRTELGEVRAEVRATRASSDDLRKELKGEIASVRSSHDAVRNELVAQRTLQEVTALGINNLSTEVHRQRALVERGTSASLDVQTQTAAAPTRIFKGFVLIVFAILINIIVSLAKK